jgi:hypothetical protein
MIFITKSEMIDPDSLSGKTVATCDLRLLASKFHGRHVSQRAVGDYAFLRIHDSIYIELTDIVSSSTFRKALIHA